MGGEFILLGKGSGGSWGRAGLEPEPRRCREEGLIWVLGGMNTLWRLEGLAEGGFGSSNESRGVLGRLGEVTIGS